MVYAGHILAHMELSIELNHGQIAKVITNGPGIISKSPSMNLK